jgi:hypothetical protein
MLNYNSSIYCNKYFWGTQLAVVLSRYNEGMQARTPSFQMPRSPSIMVPLSVPACKSTCGKRQAQAVRSFAARKQEHLMREHSRETCMCGCRALVIHRKTGSISREQGCGARICVVVEGRFDAFTAHKVSKDGPTA